MAVNAGQRHVPDTAGNRALDACEYARELAIHTIKICNNKNIFKPEYQSALTNRIIALAVDIYTNAWGANNILVRDDSERWHERHHLQELAANECNRLLALIQLAKTLFHLRQKKVKFWGDMTKKKCDQCYASWRSYATGERKKNLGKYYSKPNTYKLIKRMDEYYDSLWKEDKDEDRKNTDADTRDQGT